jgi:hypothetical protein
MNVNIRALTEQHAHRASLVVVTAVMARGIDQDQSFVPMLFHRLTEGPDGINSLEADSQDCSVRGQLRGCSNPAIVKAD